MSAPGLLPCPFCGSPPRAWGAQRLEADGTCFESIGCCNPDCDFEPGTDYLPWDDAVTAWNRRAASPEVQALIAAAEARGWNAAIEAAENTLGTLSGGIGVTLSEIWGGSRQADRLRAKREQLVYTIEVIRALKKEP